MGEGAQQVVGEPLRQAFVLDVARAQVREEVLARRTHVVAVVVGITTLRRDGGEIGERFHDLQLASDAAGSSWFVLAIAAASAPFASAVVHVEPEQERLHR